MSAGKSTAGPWEIVAPSTRRTTYTIRRNVGDASNSVEWLSNKRGRPIRFRSREAAEVALSKTRSTS